MSEKSKVKDVFLRLLLVSMVLIALLVLPKGILVSSASPGNNCEIQVRNLANQTVAGVTVEVWNATSGLYLDMWNYTDGTGQVNFMLETGNYTFKAFWKDVEVGTVDKNVTEKVALQLNCTRLSNLKLTVTNETGAPIPFIDLNLSYNYTTRANETIQEPPTSFITNINGNVQLQNMFTNVSYLIEARRYGFLFNTTLTPPLPTQAWNNITITAPKYTMSIHVTDSHDASAVGLKVEAFEWSSGTGELAQPAVTTDNDGNVTLSLTFGRYRLRLYKGDAFINEVTIDLTKNQSSSVVRIDTYNITLNVHVVDYFGQPISNVLVTFQRKVNSNYQATENQTTGADGVASFSDIIGGDSRVLVSVAGSPNETQDLHLVGPTRDVVFKMDGYVAVVGYALETSQFVTIIMLLILIVSFIIASTYKRLLRLLQRRKR